MRKTGTISLNRSKKLLSIGLLLCSTAMIVFWARKDIPATELSERHFTFSYKLDLDTLPDSSEIDIWLPLPPSNEHQMRIGYTVDARLEYDEYIDPEHGNRILHLRGLSHENNKVEVTFEINRQEVNALSITGKTESKEILDRYLLPSRLIPIDGVIAAEAESVFNTRRSPLTNARTLYDHLFNTMSYDKSGTGWGLGDAVFACDARRGNCTDIHSFYIGMLRSQGIPARFIIGFPLPEDKESSSIDGYHCWAEFWVEDKGWIPVDISEAIKHPEKKEYLFGHLDHDRVAFTTGRDILLDAPSAKEKLNYLIYPFILVNGLPLDGEYWEFSFSDISDDSVSDRSL